MTSEVARTAGAGLLGSLARHLTGGVRKLIGSRRASRSERLAVVCDSFVRYGSEQAIGLKAAGADVVFYYIDRLAEFDGNAEDRAAYLGRVSAAGVPVVRLPARSLRALPRHIWDLHRDLGRRRVGTLIVQAHVDPRYATLPFRYPVATIVHDPRPHTGDFDSAFPLPVRVLARAVEVTSAALFLHSSLLLPQLYPMLRRAPVGVFPHGTDMAESAATIVSPPTVVLVGRLMEYKGIDTALAAFERVRAERPDAVMVLAGRGNMGAQIREASPSGVELRDGYIPDAELHELIKTARLILLPYKDATQSGVGLVAVAQGLPCIVTATGALPDLVPPGYEGWVVPVGDSARLADAILTGLDHRQADRDAVFEYASTHFAWPVVGAQMLRELEHLGLRPSRQGGA